MNERVLWEFSEGNLKVQEVESNDQTDAEVPLPGISMARIRFTQTVVKNGQPRVVVIEHRAEQFLRMLSIVREAALTKK